MKDRPRKVIFVAGTAYSGSTHLNLVVGNDPSALACGELHAFARPYLPYHLNPNCGCGDEACRFWSRGGLDEADGHQIYLQLFERDPDLRFIVDSSKVLRWIRPMRAALKRAGVEVELLLIWKSPEDYFESKRKRGELNHWARSWIRYHRAFLACFDDCMTVNYTRFVSDPDVLRQVCQALGIQWFAEKADYSNRRQHLLFGNSSTRVGLATLQSDERGRMERELALQREMLARSEVTFTDAASASDQRTFSRLVHELELRDVGLRRGATRAEPQRFRWSGFVPWYLSHCAAGWLQTQRLRIQSKTE